MAASILSRGSASFDVFSYSRPSITISLDNQTDRRVPAYTTGDRVQGTVTVSADHLTGFDEIDIKLEGFHSVSMDRGALPGRTGACQTFLRLRQPVAESSYPTPRVLEPGRSYQFPFTFVIPQRLLPHACNHNRKNAHIEHSHTLLPPTLGDPMLAFNGRSLLDDMSPDMCRVTYQIRAEAVQKPVAPGPAKSLKVVEKKIRVVPTVEEEPPLTVLDTDSIYCIRKEKNVKRGTFRPNLGRLVAAASQPKPLQLNPPNEETCESVSTVANVHLRFDPVGNEEPPSLGSIWSKLRVSTYYAVHPWEDYPNSSIVSALGQLGQSVYNETVPLSTLCIASAQWTKHSAGDLMRRDSLQSTSSGGSFLLGPSGSFAGKTFYLASVAVPVTLPKKKVFVPTFHSCLMSRVYTLELCVSYHTPNMNILTPTVSLKLPLQVTSRARSGTGSKQAQVEITQEEVDAEYFSPRSVAPPAPAVTSAPPEYSSLQRPRLLSESTPNTPEVPCQ